MENIEYKADGIYVLDEFVNLHTIREKCMEANVKINNLVLLQIVWKGSRNFDGLSETTVFDKNAAIRIMEIITGRTIYFGEINGKHSDIYGEIEEDEISIIEDPTEVRDFYLANPNGSKYEHSFLHQFLQDAQDGRYEDDEISEEIINEFRKLVR